MADIETIYRACIYYEGEADEQKGVEEVAFKAGMDLDVDSFPGCPACGPYLEAKGDDIEAVTEWSVVVEQFIQSQEGLELVS